MWKIQLTMVHNFISSIDHDEEHVIHSKINNIEIMINDEAGKVIEKLFELLKNIYQNNVEWTRGSAFVSDYVKLL